jgi:hypothetical protein
LELFFGISHPLLEQAGQQNEEAFMLHRIQVKVLCAIVLFVGITVAIPVSPRAEDRQGLSSPNFELPSPGFKVLYMFVGVCISTMAVILVYCINFDRVKTVNILVEFVDFNSTIVGTGTFQIAPGETRTFTAPAGGSAFYAEDVAVTVTSDLNQGSVRVSSEAVKGKLLCTAQVLDSVNNPPNFVVTLPIFNTAGKF